MPFGAELDAGGECAFGCGRRLRSRSSSCSTGRRRGARSPCRRSRGRLVRAGHRARRTPGSRYRFRIDGELEVPDPASRFNPEDVHGPSEVVDPRAFEWRDDAWRGRPWHEAVIYELHVGTFTPEGTFAGVEKRLDHLAELGITAIELMPIADFPGERGWGYDGVLPFAPDAAYGRPDELKALVDAAHARGLAVMLDVVYNHFGPEGNYLHAYAPQFFTDRHHTPWGAAINFDGAQAARCATSSFTTRSTGSRSITSTDCASMPCTPCSTTASRTFIDGDRARACARGPGRERPIYLVLENGANEARYLGAPRCAPRRHDAQWNDDVHHCLHVS